MLTRLYRAAFVRALMLSETLRRLTLRGVCAWMALISPVALADGDLADMAKAGAEGAKSVQSSGVTIIQVAGFFAVAGGILSIKAMKNNPQIRPWMIALAIIGGLLAIGITEIIKRGMTQINLAPVTVS
ncbi:conjugal transfer protein (plasmid) [Pantoea sp. JZ2]|uniref:DUF6750 family protein n=1 Tax=Pantoea TaxID=53335 RepID=UPI000FEC800A|nr:MULTISPECIES: DUF6750 family protein [Pantoea]QAB32637.1 conjugal transfer protein [Pantoea ananatis]WRH15904.1 conjugal transfer protein [Pantoea sp. JZ2]